jgi:hypothetical protein
MSDYRTCPNCEGSAYPDNNPKWEYDKVTRYYECDFCFAKFTVTHHFKTPSHTSDVYNPDEVLPDGEWRSKVKTTDEVDRSLNIRRPDDE